MANRDQAVGAFPFGQVLRESPYIAAETIYAGDFVKMDSSGTLARCAAQDAMCGVASNYGLAGATINVYDDPCQQFVIQSSDATIAAQTDLNLNYDIVVGSPNTTYKRSGMQLDASVGNVPDPTVATLPLKPVKINPESGNALGSKVDVVVIINNHQLNGDTGTVGV